VSPDEQLATGFAYAGGFVREAIRALRGKLLVTSRTATQADVQLYFETRSSSAKTEEYADVVAIESIPYQLILNCRCIEEQFDRLAAGRVLLDIGCGTARLLNNLRSRGFGGEYVGFDIDRIVIKELSRRAFDGRASFLTGTFDQTSFDIAMLCNVLVYCQTDAAVDILRRLRKASRDDGRIIVMEPHPRWYWEFEFDGIKLMPRTSRVMTEMLNQSGWYVRHAVDVSLLKIRSKGLFAIAYGLVAHQN